MCGAGNTIDGIKIRSLIGNPTVMIRCQTKILSMTPVALVITGERLCRYTQGAVEWVRVVVKHERRKADPSPPR